MAEVEGAPLIAETGPNGLPLLAEEPAAGGSPLLPVGMSVVRIIIGFLLAWPIWHFAPAGSKELKLEKVEGYGYSYLSAWCFSVLVAFLNTYPMVFKEKLKLKGNIRANMQLFKVLQPEAKDAMPLVGLEEEGAVGEYNRANRSLFHFLENMPGFLVCMFPAGFVFPLPGFIATLVFCIGRIWHQIGYVVGYGKHGPGFLLAMLSTLMVEGLVLWSALNLLGVAGPWRTA